MDDQAKNMFQFEFDKRPPYSETGRRYPKLAGNISHMHRPLPPRPTSSQRLFEKTTVPLKVWIIASASCFAVCGALVLATVCITKWGTTESFTTRELIEAHKEPESFYPTWSPNQRLLRGRLFMYIVPSERSQTKTAVYPNPAPRSLNRDPSSEEMEDLQILEKLSIFKNMVANRDHKSLIAKPQIHPLHEEVLHEERNTKKKDKPIESDSPRLEDQEKLHIVNQGPPDLDDDSNILVVPKFKPLLPAFKHNGDSDLTYGYDAKEDYFYNDENFYDDYMQSNTMTSYLIEKVQELHDWVSTDPDLNGNHTSTGTDFSSLLKALNESMVDGNLTIVMSKLKDMYLGENYTNVNSSRKIIITNSTDLLSFGILTLDVMLLHNIQLMAWESQESARIKMMKDPDVFAFNSLFMDPSKVEVKQNDVTSDSIFLKRLYPKQDAIDDMDIGKNLLENILEVGMSTARAAIHLGRAYKNTRNIITQLQTKNATVPSPISRNIDANTHALNRLQTSFDSTSVAKSNISSNGSFYTELDCVWLLYCRNLVATTKLNAPYGTMARINGVALRMLTGELPANRALDTMLFEVFTGWTELKCNDMFPRCSKVNAASIVMDSVIQGHRKPPTTNRGR